MVRSHERRPRLKRRLLVARPVHGDALDPRLVHGGALLDVRDLELVIGACGSAEVASVGGRQQTARRQKQRARGGAPEEACWRGDTRTLAN